MTSDQLARRERASRRAELMVIRKGRLGHSEVDFTPVKGDAAISLATRLTIEAFELAGVVSPKYSRDEMPVRFVARTGS